MLLHSRIITGLPLLRRPFEAPLSLIHFDYAQIGAFDGASAVNLPVLAQYSLPRP